MTLAGRVAEAHGRVDLQVWLAAPHVFQGFASMLDEGLEALDSIGAFISGRLDARTGGAA